MGVVLLILKILGIILLSIIGLFLLVLIIILVTPVRYRLEGSYRDKVPDVSVNISIWLKLINIKIAYTRDGLSGGMRIFFIKKALLKKVEGTEAPADEALQGELPEPDENAGEEDDAAEAEGTDTETEEQKPEEAAKAEADSSATEGEEAAADGQTSAETKKPETLPEKIIAKVRGLYEKAVSLYEKICKKKKAVEWLLGKPETMRLLKRIKVQLLKTVKSIKPRKGNGRLKIGLENPKTMGMICMYGGILYPSVSGKLELQPVFDEKVIEGEGYIKGRLIAGAIAGHLLKIIVCRDFFRTYKNLKTFKKHWR